MRFNAPRDSDEAALMNARKKEKKKLWELGKQPKNNAEWVALGEHMVKWHKDNNNVRNKNDFALRHGYVPSNLRKWTRLDEGFNEAYQVCVALCLERREQYMEQQQKLYLQYMKELPLYNLELADYEKEQAETEATNSKANVTVVYAQPKHTEAGDEWQKKGKE